MSETLYLGKSEKIPFKPNSIGEVELIEKNELIQQSILDIITTPQGTIFSVEEYGSLIHRLSFMQNDNVLQSLLIYFVSKAVFDWEKRVQIMSIDCTIINEVQTNCLITYKILASNEIDAFIYPFYKDLKS